MFLLHILYTTRLARLSDIVAEMWKHREDSSLIGAQGPPPTGLVENDAVSFNQPPMEPNLFHSQAPSSSQASRV